MNQHPVFREAGITIGITIGCLSRILTRAIRIRIEQLFLIEHRIQETI